MCNIIDSHRYLGLKKITQREGLNLVLASHINKVATCGDNLIVDAKELVSPEFNVDVLVFKVALYIFLACTACCSTRGSIER